VAIDTTLVIWPDHFPSESEMRRSIAVAGDPLAFPDEVDLQTFSGYLPLVAYGQRTGFEFYFAPLEDGDVPEAAKAYGSSAVTVSAGASLQELRASFLFLKVVARLAGGALVIDDSQVVAPEAVAAFLDEQIRWCDLAMPR
jgi:hypothetical protein